MAKIKVKLGGCGIKYTDANGNARHALKTPEHGPFECDDAQAARLVGLGVAEYVGTQWREQEADPEPQPDTGDGSQAPDAQQGDTGDDSQDPENVSGHLDAAQLETMTNEQLKNLAGDLGIDVSKCKKKADYIAAIVAVEVEVEPDAIVDDPDNELPELGAADPE